MDKFLDIFFKWFIWCMEMITIFITVVTCIGIVASFVYGFIWVIMDLIK